MTAIGDWWLQAWNAKSILETEYQNNAFVTVSRLLKHQVNDSGDLFIQHNLLCTTEICEGEFEFQLLKSVNSHCLF